LVLLLDTGFGFWILDFSFLDIGSWFSGFWILFFGYCFALFDDIKVIRLQPVFFIIRLPVVFLR
jgi:hypothetical protein